MSLNHRLYKFILYWYILIVVLFMIFLPFYKKLYFITYVYFNVLVVLRKKISIIEILYYIISYGTYYIVSALYSDNTIIISKRRTT